MYAPYYYEGQRRAAMCYGVKTASRASQVGQLESLVKTILTEAQRGGTGNGPLPLPLGTGAGLTAAINTDGNPITHGVAAGFGGRGGAFLGERGGRVLGSIGEFGLNLLPLKGRAHALRRFVADNLPQLGAGLGEWNGIARGTEFGELLADKVDAATDRVVNSLSTQGTERT